MHPLALPAPAPARGTTTRRLIVGGIVAALVGMAVIGLLTPATTATRIEGIQRAQDVLEHGGAPLLARIGGRDSPVGNTHDPGIYLYGSLIGWLAGQQDPVTSIKWLYMALYGFTLALYPWLFYRLLGSRAAAIAAPFAGLLLIASAGLFDVYSIMTWAAMTLLPILFVVRERW